MNPLVSSLVIGAGVATFALVMAIVGLRSRRNRGADLGEVSNQWVMEHRIGPGGQEATRWNQR